MVVMVIVRIAGSARYEQTGSANKARYRKNNLKKDPFTKKNTPSNRAYEKNHKPLDICSKP